MNKIIGVVLFAAMLGSGAVQADQSRDSGQTYEKVFTSSYKDTRLDACMAAKKRAEDWVNRDRYPDKPERLVRTSECECQSEAFNSYTCMTTATIAKPEK